jgi:predicted DNA-binding transcriptional regulator AlpA
MLDESYVAERPGVEKSAANGKLLRLPEVLKRFPVSKTTWWEGVKIGRYPKPVKIGPRMTAWFESDIDQTINLLRQEAQSKARRNLNKTSRSPSETGQPQSLPTDTSDR